MAKAYLIIMLLAPNGVETEINMGFYLESLCLNQMERIHALKHDNIDAACVPAASYHMTKNNKAEKIFH